MSRLVATYEIESPVGIEKAAAVIAGEQSTGTFVKLAAETDELRQQSGAQVESIKVLSSTAHPSLPGKQQSGQYERGLIKISWPQANMGASLTNLQATIAGNLFELSELSAIRLLDVNLPVNFVSQCSGPAFGIDGTRKVTNVQTGPVVGTIVKPSVGMDADTTAKLVQKLAAADIDFIKDDELQANGPHCPFSDRVAAVMDVISRHEDKTGKRIMYAFNITDDIDTMRRNYDLLKTKRATCAMVSLFSVGLSGLQDVRKHGNLVIHGHRAGWGVYSRSPDIGVAFPVWQKLWRLAGADHLHVNGFANKFSESDEIVAQSAKAVQLPLSGNENYEYRAMPVFSSAQTAWQMEPARRVLGNNDFILTAGGGIMSHPKGPTAGVMALRQAADAVSKNQSLHDYATEHPELSQALQAFSKPVFTV